MIELPCCCSFFYCLFLLSRASTSVSLSNCTFRFSRWRCLDESFVFCWWVSLAFSTSDWSVAVPFSGPVVMDAPKRQGRLYTTKFVLAATNECYLETLTLSTVLSVIQYVNVAIVDSQVGQITDRSARFLKSSSHRISK